MTTTLGKRNLLVIDFDYFFPMIELPQQGREWALYDWGHSEAHVGDYINTLWAMRAQGFLSNDLPLPGIDLNYATFWCRFPHLPDTVTYADSNRYAINPLLKGALPAQFESVWLYDAHHDAGYDEEGVENAANGKISCDNWMLAYDESKRFVRYPTWRDWEAMEPRAFGPVRRKTDQPDLVNATEFTDVFVCRSGAWVPPWLEFHFWKFLDMFPGSQLEVGPCEPREWNDEEAHALNAQMMGARDEMAKINSEQS